MIEKNEISEHEIRVFLFVAKSSQWVSSKDISNGAKVAPRTARSHALKLVKLGLFDVAEVFPSHRYRLSEKAEKRNASYFIRLQKAAEIFGLTL